MMYGTHIEPCPVVNYVARHRAPYRFGRHGFGCHACGIALVD